MNDTTTEPDPNSPEYKAAMRAVYSQMGRNGGRSKSPAKVAAARRNAILGGKAKYKRYNAEQIALKRELLVQARAKREELRKARVEEDIRSGRRPARGTKEQRAEDLRTGKRQPTLEERRRAWKDGEGNIRYD